MKILQMIALIILTAGFAPAALASSRVDASMQTAAPTPTPAHTRSDKRDDALRATPAPSLPGALDGAGQLPASSGHPSDSDTSESRPVSWQSLLPGSIQ